MNDTADLLRIDPTAGAVEELGDPGLGFQPSGLAFSSLPISCPADSIGDGIADFFDVLFFVQVFAAGCP